MKKILKFFVYFCTLFVILIASSASVFVYKSLQGVPSIRIASLKNQPKSTIYDEEGNLVEVFGETKEEYVTYEQIPPVLVQALLSIEDIHFFSHPGVDAGRTFKAFLHNLTSSSTQGGSTITQQLIKNMILTNEQSYKRKIQEAYLALQIEKELTKEEILTLYFNYIYFEQSIPGVQYASKRYFGKDVSLINLPEACVLAAVVKSASYYNPFKYPDRIQNRKNLVAKKMKEYGFIDEKVYQSVVATQIEDIVIQPGELYEEPTYRFQSYLDIVYQEINEYTGLDPYKVPLEIHTYLDSSLQLHLDEIQKGNVIAFSDEDQQIGASVVRNEDGALVGVIGGRNYNGSRIFNRAYNLKRQPASTMKPIFGYLLAAEHLHYNSATNVLDAPYTYPNTSITVQNADKSYAGYISLVDALGYSKNTSALYTLEKVEKKIGRKALEQHLKDIGIMDEGPFAFPYGIGGMTYGTSPTNLAAAYSVLLRKGQYIKPSTISYIRNMETGEIIYQRDLSTKKIVSEESAFQIASSLIQVVEKDYYHIGVVRVPNVTIGAKTGTNGYDEKAASILGYPLSSDKDSWICGFSLDYSLAVWSGFDQAEKGDHHYFGKGDSRRKVPKLIFQEVMESISLKKKGLKAPSNLVPVTVTKGCDGYYLPNAYIPSYYQMQGYFYQNEVPTQILEDPYFPTINQSYGFVYDNELQLEWLYDKEKEHVFDYTKLFGERGFLIQYTLDEQSFSYFTKESKFILPYDERIKKIKIIPSFENKKDVQGTPYEFDL